MKQMLVRSNEQNKAGSVLLVVKRRYYAKGAALLMRAAAHEPRVCRVIAMDICTKLF
jgi:hypothetical protein